MKQKIIRTGNSAAVIIPKEVLEEKNLKIGDIAEIEVEPAFEADAKIHDLTQKIIKEYRSALEELARK